LNSRGEARRQVEMRSRGNLDSGKDDPSSERVCLANGIACLETIAGRIPAPLGIHKLLMFKQLWLSRYRRSFEFVSGSGFLRAGFEISARRRKIRF
jgi:hypothetical protein